MSRRYIRAFALVAALLVLIASPLLAQTIPTPSEFLHIEVGADGVMADWDQIVSYFKAIDPLSDRITVEEIGRTTEDRPYILAIITSEANHETLAALQAVNDRLSDPRNTSPEEARTLVERGKTVVCIQMSIHSTEVGAAQMSMELAHRMLTESSPVVREILDNTIIVLSPSHNPDGTQMVAEWVRRTEGTPYEGTGMPWLYQKYTGHDNNRDWYFFTQVESRITVDKIWNVWKPQISYDLHQMGSTAARIFAPPYVDPYDPNIDPILRASNNALGSNMALTMTGRGLDGVVISAMYDMWTPARGYVNYHGGIRVLTEAASARLVFPVEVKVEELSRGIGYDAKQVSWNFPRPWRGGSWRLRDIMDYEHVAIEALLLHAARFRSQWLENFYRVNQNAVGRTLPENGEPKPFAIIVPPAQKDPLSAMKLLEVMRIAAVEVHRARAPFTAGGRGYAAGTYVILMAQPASPFAKTMTDIQHYPDIRQYPGGPPQRPYDVTAHTLQLLMGVDLTRVMEPFEADLEMISTIEPQPGEVVGGRASRYYVMEHGAANVIALNRLLKAGLTVQQSSGGFDAAGRSFPAGTYIIAVGGQRNVHDTVAGVVEASHVAIYAVNDRLDRMGVVMRQVRAPRIGLYKSWVPSMDEGWTRWLLEQFEFPCASLQDAEVREGNLEARYDVIVIPDQAPQSIVDGHAPGTMPDEYVGGMGKEGVAAIKAFVEAGGTLVTLDSASLFAIEELGLPVKNSLAELSGGEGGRAARQSADFYAPGSIVKTNVDVSHPIGYGFEPESIAWFEQSPAFDVSGSARAVVTYPTSGSPLLSGWLLGGEKLNGKAAVVDAPVRSGRVVLFGFRPQYRAQTWATFRLLFNALYYSTLGQGS